MCVAHRRAQKRLRLPGGERARDRPILPRTLDLECRVLSAVILNLPGEERSEHANAVREGAGADPSALPPVENVEQIPLVDGERVRVASEHVDEVPEDRAVRLLRSLGCTSEGELGQEAVNRSVER